MSRINIDDVAFKDPRFKLLAGSLGITWQEALGRCLPVWALAYARRTPVLRASDIDSLSELPGFAAAMLTSELAVEDPAGVYLCGVADRIDFLLIQDAKREKARKTKLAAAGVTSPRRPSRGRVPGDVPGESALPGEGPGGHPRGWSRGTVPGEGPYSPSPDHAHDRDPPRPAAECPPVGPCPVPQEEPPKPLLPGSIARAETRRRVIAEAWQAGGDAFRELGRDGIETNAPDAWAGLPAASSQAMKLLIAVVDQLLIGDEPDAESALSVIRRRIAVAAAEGRAESPPTRRWLTPMRIWDPTSFAKGAEMSPEQVRPRAGPGGSAGRAFDNRRPEPKSNLRPM